MLVMGMTLDVKSVLKNIPNPQNIAKKQMTHGKDGIKHQKAIKKKSIPKNVIAKLHPIKRVIKDETKNIAKP
jgi:hypothetical protein